MASSSSLVLDEARLLLSRTLFPIFLLAPMTTTVDEQRHVDVVRHLLQETWSCKGLNKFVTVDGPSGRTSLVTAYVLSLLAYPFYRSDPDVDIAATQVRVVLSLFSAFSSVWLARRIRPTFGTRTAKYYLVFEATQLLATREMTRLDAVSLAVPLVRVASALLIAPRLPIPLDDDLPPGAGGGSKARSNDTLLGLGLLALASVALCPALLALFVPNLWSAWSNGLMEGVQAVAVVAGWVGVEGFLTSLIDVKSTDPLVIIAKLRNQISNLVIQPRALNTSAVLLPYLTLLGPSLLFSTFAFLVDSRCRRLLGPALVALSTIYYFGVGDEQRMHKARVMVLVSSTASNLCAAASARVVGIMFGTTTQKVVLGTVIVGNLSLAFVSTARATI
ncbi:BQ2448_8063 [Microbotryum intermedium]|uniref:BQ2448_8063 protein n=1 Tax=Microbotryum intermedium TaxID=269621 RepID=A0A238FRC6_9BASI|nr:BQ2448_8063 [Microbotryum intermedium]